MAIVGERRSWLAVFSIALAATVFCHVAYSLSNPRRLEFKQNSGIR
jgi:hypothetical protein